MTLHVGVCNAWRRLATSASLTADKFRLSVVIVFHSDSFSALSAPKTFNVKDTAGQSTLPELKEERSKDPFLMSNTS